MSSLEVRNGAEGPHRVFAGTPEKVIKRRVIETLSAEGKPVYEAVLIQKEQVDNPDFCLEDGEILITHKKISSDQERDLSLARAGCSEIVVVVEALILLEDDFNAAYVSLGASRDFAGLLEEVMRDAHKEEKPTFSRFCAIFWEWLEKAAVGKPENQVHSSVLETGGVFFTRVGEQVAAEHSNNNKGLKRVACFNVDNLLAWVSLYKAKIGRHQQSHPFKFIGHDVSAAESGLNVLEYVLHKDVYKNLYPLLQVAIPHVRKAIHDHLDACNVANRQMKPTVRQVAEYMQHLKPKVDRKLREQEKADPDFPFDFVADDE